MNDVQAFEKHLNTIDLDPSEEIQSIQEMQVEYVEYLKKSKICNFNISSWLPSLGSYMRPLVAGELGVVLASTGAGKTAILQNIAMASNPLKVLFFEIELPGSLMFERFLSMQEKMSGRDIESFYREGKNFPPTSLEHISVCTRSQLDVHQIQSLIDLSEKKIGQRPALVLLDYIGLVGGKGNSRYERMSYIAEQLKIIAKATDTIIISACQIHRKSGEDETGEIYLHDAKDSGSIENSAGLVLGAWRDGSEGELMKLKICKNTKGKPGAIVTVNFNQNTLRIYE